MAVRSGSWARLPTPSRGDPRRPPLQPRAAFSSSRGHAAGADCAEARPSSCEVQRLRPSPVAELEESRAVPAAPAQVRPGSVHRGAAVPGTREERAAPASRAWGESGCGRAPGCPTPVSPARPRCQAPGFTPRAAGADTGSPQHRRGGLWLVWTVCAGRAPAALFAKTSEVSPLRKPPPQSWVTRPATTAAATYPGACTPSLTRAAPLETAGRRHHAGRHRLP